MNNPIRLSIFYGTAFFVIGVYTPFWPAWLSGNGLEPREIGILLAVTTWTRVAAGPLVAQAADHYGKLKPIMVTLAIITFFCFALYSQTTNYAFLLAIAFLLGCSFSPMLPLAETLTLDIASITGVSYGRMRLWGSLTFILAALGGGTLLNANPGLQAPDLILFGCAAIVLSCLLLPDLQLKKAPVRQSPVALLLTSPIFLLFLTATGLVQGSHAALYGFSTLHWKSLGWSNTSIGLFWAESVIAEVLLFAISGFLLQKFGICKLLFIGALAATVRWVGTGLAKDLHTISLLQVSHALTFAATHLASVHFVRRIAPEGTAGTAQSLYSAIGLGVSSAVLMSVSGFIFQHSPAGAFYCMAGSAGTGLIFICILWKKWDGNRLSLKRPQTKYPE
jgi:PPP family 3-phenylpropionic acid transporter